MVMAKRLFQQVADEAHLLQYWAGMGCMRMMIKCFWMILVESGAWLDLELKIPFLALWVNSEDFDNPDWEDPIIGLTQKNLRKFAAMAPAATWNRCGE